MSDIDDDPDEEVSAADKQKWFQDDVVDLIKKSLADRVVYSCIIGELDQTRQAHSQKPAALNKEVVRTMIYLPFSVNFAINGDLEVYGSTFRELLEKYDPLLRNLNKNKEAQLTGVDHVTTPFLELIRSDKLNAADWSTRKVGPVLNALKKHYIIEEVRIRAVMAVIEQGIAEIVHQRSVQQLEMDQMDQQQEAEWRSLFTLGTDLVPAVASDKNQQGLELVDVFEQELTDKNMYEIAKRIFPDNLDELAIKLNIRLVEFEQIKDCNPKSSHRQSFLVLRTWYSRLPQPKTNAIAQLKAALLSTSNGDAAHVLMMTLVADLDAASVSVSTSMPAVVPDETQQGSEDMEVELVGVLKPQPDTENCPMVERERHRQQSPLTSERFGGMFDHTGGTLDTYLTNDYLVIPPGAIPNGAVYSIWGSVHSALDKFDEWIKKDKGERLIAPVNEICVEGNKHFLKPVILVIHHAVTKAELLAKVEIKLLEDDGSVLEVKPAHKHVKGKPWFEINSERIEIHTLQLCKALCKVDSGNKIEGTLRGILYGQMYEKGGKYIAEVEFYMQFSRSVQSLQGQRENFRSWRTDSGCAYLDIQDFATSLDRLNYEDKFVIEFVFSEEDANKWVLRKESDNRESEVIPLKCLISCLDKLSDDPINVTKYAFNSTTSPVMFPLVAKLKVKIVHEPSNGNYGISLGIKMPRAFGRQYNEQEGAQAQAQAPASVSKRELSEQKMMAIAERISPDNLPALAIKLGMQFVDVEHIKHAHPNSSSLQSFLVLRKWYSLLLPPKTSAIAQLETALRATSNGDAANVLNEQ